MKRVKLLDHVVSNHKLILPHGTKDVHHKQKCQIQCMSKKKGRKGVRSWYYLRQVRDCLSPTTHSCYLTSSHQARWLPCHVFSSCKSVMLRCCQHANLQEIIPSFVEHLRLPSLQRSAWLWSGWESWAMIVINWHIWGDWRDRGSLPYWMADLRWQSTWSAAPQIVPGSRVPRCDDEKKVTTWEHDHILQLFPHQQKFKKHVRPL